MEFIQAYLICQVLKLNCRGIDSHINDYPHVPPLRKIGKEFQVLSTVINQLCTMCEVSSAGTKNFIMRKSVNLLCHTFFNRNLR